MTAKDGDLEVRDLGSTNGIRINGHRVELGRLRLGDELSIAHIRFRLDDGVGLENTLAASGQSRSAHSPRNGYRNGHDHGAEARAVSAMAAPGLMGEQSPSPAVSDSPASRSTQDSALAAKVRDLLPAELAGCKIVILQMPGGENADPMLVNHGSEPKGD